MTKAADFLGRLIDVLVDAAQECTLIDADGDPAALSAAKSRLEACRYSLQSVLVRRGALPARRESTTECLCDYDDSESHELVKKCLFCHMNEARANEREQCAKLCDNMSELRRGFRNYAPNEVSERIERFAAATASELGRQIRKRGAP